ERPLAYLVLSALICAAAAVTKQAGLYILFWYPALCYGLAFAPANRSLKKIWLIIGVWLLSLAISLPWYIFIQDQIIHGLASSEVGFVTSNIYQLLGFDWGFRIAIGIFQLGFIFWVLLAVAIWYALNRSTWRILIVLIIPYTLIWLGFYSYALRNFTLISPLLGLIAALGCEKLYSTGLLRKQAKKVLRFLCLHELKPLHVIFAISIAVAFVSLIPQYSAPNLVQAQIAQKRLLGDSGLNKMLFQYQASHGFSGKILTSWDYLGHVPGLAQYYQPYRPGDVEGNPYQSSWMMDPKQLPSVLAAYPAHYILVANEWGLASDAYLQYFAQLESQHVLKAVLRLPDFTLYEIVQAIPRQQS
ncbi:MAG: hypothetical protein K0Q57_651, partial [Gammaproteobacteria bacterium]|nr:hypothetical protein [Gammaproteobacteria bacterium]